MTQRFDRPGSAAFNMLDPATKTAMEKESAVRLAKLSYLGKMLSEFRGIARSINEQQLVYLLELAMMEANLQLDITRYCEDLEEDV